MKNKFWKIIAIIEVIALCLLAFAELVEVQFALERIFGVR